MPNRPGSLRARAPLGRELTAIGHETRLMPLSYVKAYVKRNKHDVADAEAICEAVRRPPMRFVPLKSAEQQSALMMHRARDLLIRQRTMLVNAAWAFGRVRSCRGAGLQSSKTNCDCHGRDGRARTGYCRQVLKVIVRQIEDLRTSIARLEAWSRVAQEQPGQPTSSHHPGDQTRSSPPRLLRRLPIRNVFRSGRGCCLAGASAETELNRWQSAPRWNQQTGQLSPPPARQQFTHCAVSLLRRPPKPIPG